MSIPLSQLETWKNSGADDSAMTTYNRVKNVIEADDSIPNQKGKDFQVYLQGSYKNSSNIYADNDVDIVVQLDPTSPFKDFRHRVVEGGGPHPHH